jgi:hypothetical protein
MVKDSGVARTLLKTAYYPGFSIIGADLRKAM